MIAFEIDGALLVRMLLFLQHVCVPGLLLRSFGLYGALDDGLAVRYFDLSLALSSAKLPGVRDPAEGLRLLCLYGSRSASDPPLDDDFG